MPFFGVVFSDLKPPFFGVVCSDLKPPFFGVVCSDLKPPFLGSGGHQRPKSLALPHIFSHGMARTTSSFSQSHQEALRTRRKSPNSHTVDSRRNTVLKTAVVTGRYCLTKRTGLSAEFLKHRRICPGTSSKRKSPFVQRRHVA